MRMAMGGVGGVCYGTGGDYDEGGGATEPLVMHTLPIITIIPLFPTSAHS